jgi:predicted amidohydrolase
VFTRGHALRLTIIAELDRPSTSRGTNTERAGQIEMRLRVALAQYLSGCEPADIVAEAKAAAADIVVFPEMYSNGYARFDPDDPSVRARWCADAHSLDGDFVRKFRETARTHRMHVVATFLEAAEPKPFNSALLIDPGGRPVLHHRKVHICDFDSPEIACGRGATFEVCDIEAGTGAVRLGLMICMDREYPEAARSLSRQGAEIALVPNCCDLAADQACGDVRVAQMRGRAFETVMGIAVANYPAPRCDGHSFAVDPSGRVIAMADHSPGLTIADFDLAAIRKARIEDRFRWQI